MAAKGSDAAGVYEVRNIITGERYIGSSVCLRRRWTKHRACLKNGTSYHPRLMAAWAQYGESAFEFRTLEVCERDKDTLRAREQKWMDALKPEYNVNPIATSTLGLKMGPDTRAKMSIKLLGNKHALGTHQSPEARAKQSIRGMGNTWALGYKQSPETRANMSVAQSARWARERMIVPIRTFGSI